MIIVLLGAYLISIHILRVEDDTICEQSTFFVFKFQSTSSVWRMTTESDRQENSNPISIHILRVEDD